MALPNIYTQTVAETLIGRIQKLTAKTVPSWGKMDVAQMLAHCNIVYEMAFDGTHKKSNPILRFILKNLVKGGVVNETPFKKNSSTPPQLKITSEKEFTKEQSRMLAYVKKSVEKGADYFEGLDHPAFGEMNKEEWNNLIYKHLNHHLTQFGV
jgi:hypothetical protein